MKIVHWTVTGLAGAAQQWVFAVHDLADDAGQTQGDALRGQSKTDEHR
ncbi:hypothetical protein [Streptosporangium sp. NPDC006930]